MTDLDYPVAAPVGVDPIIFRSQIIQCMAARYQQAAPDLTNEEAHDAAMATWGTDWYSDLDAPLLRALRDALSDA